MPKFPTFPYLFDEANCITIAKLKQWNYLKKDSWKSGTITWSRNGTETGSINISVRMFKDENVLTVNYKCNKTDHNYNIHLEAIPSNLGKGEVWYFICPFTGKRCRKLHLIKEKFMHRSALASGMYSKQTHSKKWRQMEKVYGSYFDRDKLYEELYSKNFTKYYNGKPTKRYLRILTELKKTDAISHIDIERLMILGK